MRNKGLILFVLCFAIAFAGGYFFYQGIQPSADVATDQAEEKGSEENQNVEQTTALATEGEVFKDLGCLSCHSVSSIGAKGGTTGPDLSQAYLNVEGKHGKPIDEFLKEPTSAVMASVIGAKPLTEEELQNVLAALKKASEQ